ncbi:hypothetical protein FB451DRAFT_1369619, partial [Mycena latifolia]
VYYLLSKYVKVKVRWLPIHLVGVFVADFLISLALRRRSSGFELLRIHIDRSLIRPSS